MLTELHLKIVALILSANVCLKKIKLMNGGNEIFKVFLIPMASENAFHKPMQVQKYKESTEHGILIFFINLRYWSLYYPIVKFPCDTRNRSL